MRGISPKSGSSRSRFFMFLIPAAGIFLAIVLIASAAYMHRAHDFYVFALLPNLLGRSKTLQDCPRIRARLARRGPDEFLKLLLRPGDGPRAGNVFYRMHGDELRITFYRAELPDDDICRERISLRMQHVLAKGDRAGQWRLIACARKLYYCRGR